MDIDLDPQHTKKDSEEYRNKVDAVAKVLASGAMGAFHAPLDVAKYSGLITNWAANATGLRDDTTANNVRKTLKNFYENTPFMPEGFNEYRGWLRDESPTAFKAGQVTGSGLIGMSKNALPYLLQKGSKLTRATAANPAIVLPAVSATGEFVVEPAADTIIDEGLAQALSGL